MAVVGNKTKSLEEFGTIIRKNPSERSEPSHLPVATKGQIKVDALVQLQALNG